MELFLVMIICSQDSFQGTPCTSASGAYWELIKGQEVADKATKRYIKPLPSELKNLGIASYALYTKHVKFNLYRGLNYEIKVDKFNEGNKVVESTNSYIVYSRNF